MTFSKRKKAPPGAVKELDKTVVVSVRLKNEQYQIALENAANPAENCPTTGDAL